MDSILALGSMLIPCLLIFLMIKTFLRKRRERAVDVSPVEFPEELAAAESLVNSQTQSEMDARLYGEFSLYERFSSYEQYNENYMAKLQEFLLKYDIRSDWRSIDAAPAGAAGFGIRTFEFFIEKTNFERGASLIETEFLRR